MRRASDGFTLIEAIVAAGLLVTIALGSAQLFMLAIGYTLGAKQQLLMAGAAVRKIDELASAAAGGTLQTSPPDALDRDLPGFSDTVAESGRTYVRRWRVSDVPGFGGDAFAMEVRVTLDGGGGDLRFATMRRTGMP